ELVKCRDARRILENAPRGLDASNNIEHCRPEPTVIVRASSLLGNRCRLAGNPCTENSTSSNISKVCNSPVSIVFNSWPFLPQQFTAIGIDFAEADCLESSPFRRNVKPTDAGA